MTSRIGPIQEDEVKIVLFDFSNEGVNGTLTTASVECLLSTGADPSPEDLIVGSAAIDGLEVTQEIQYRVPKVTYILRCVANDSSGLTHVVTALLQSKAVF